MTMSDIEVILNKSGHSSTFDSLQPDNATTLSSFHQNIIAHDLKIAATWSYYDLSSSAVFAVTCTCDSQRRELKVCFRLTSSVVDIVFWQSSGQIMENLRTFVFSASERSVVCWVLGVEFLSASRNGNLETSYLALKKQNTRR
uniref:Uncharacterized protein n=1 Tax=Candidozyma auris TaxID=498019 RepID=A0A0L0P172_CANAR